MYKKLQVLQSKHIIDLLDKIRVNFDVLSSLVKESDEKGRVSVLGFNAIQVKVASTTDLIVSALLDTIKLAVEGSIKLNVMGEEAIQVIMSSSNIEQDILLHSNFVKVQLDMMLSSFTYPGRKVNDSLQSLNNMFSGKYYSPITIEKMCTLIIGYFTNHAYNTSLVYNCMEKGVSRIKLTSDSLKELEGVYDARFVPEPDELGVYTQLEPYEDKEENTILLDGIKTYINSYAEIESKQEQLNRVEDVLPEFAPTLQEEINFLKDITEYFRNKSTSAFTREVELICSKVYSAELLPVNAPFDLINSKFLIEVKASMSSEIKDKERGHIAKGELVRKYIYATEQFLERNTEANHKYVLGVLDSSLDKLFLYEQNYLSNKNSGMMFPVAIIHNYSSISWSYKSTSNTTIIADSVAIKDSDIEMLVSNALLYNSTYLDVCKASKYNIKTGDTVLHFNKEDIAIGSITKSVPSLVDYPLSGKYVSMPISSLLTALVKDSFDLSSAKFTHYPQYAFGDICVSFIDLYLCEDLSSVSCIFLDSLILSKEQYNKVVKVAVLKELGVSISGKSVYKVITENNDYADKITDKIKILWQNSVSGYMTYTQFNEKYRLVKRSNTKDISERISTAIINDCLNPYSTQDKRKIIYKLKDSLTKLKI